MNNEQGNRLSPLSIITSVPEKILAEPIPFAFFGTLIGLKIYFFVEKIDFFTEFVSIMYGIDASFNGLKAIIFSRPFMDFTYTVTAILFDAMIIITYLIRKKPADEGGKAQGFAEKWYPLITVLLPMIAFTYMLYNPVQMENDPLFHSLYQSPNFIYLVGMAGLLFSLFGCLLSIIALWKLRRSFSLRVEVRQLVTTGMYRYMRHPLYFSELTHALGTTLLLLNSFSIPVYLIFLTMEIIRAKFEEKKFLAVIPEYAAYKRNTGFLWPKFSSQSKKQDIDQQPWTTLCNH